MLAPLCRLSLGYSWSGRTFDSHLEDLMIDLSITTKGCG